MKLKLSTTFLYVSKSCLTVFGHGCYLFGASV